LSGGVNGPGHRVAGQASAGQCGEGCGRRRILVEHSHANPRGGEGVDQCALRINRESANSGTRCGKEWRCVDAGAGAAEAAEAVNYAIGGVRGKDEGAGGVDRDSGRAAAGATVNGEPVTAVSVPVPMLFNLPSFHAA